MTAPLSDPLESISTPTTLPLPDFDSALAQARPRLLRIARLEGMGLDSCDDVVQETLLVAWRTRARLRDPQRISAWIDGICRNLCLHYRRTVVRERSRLLRLQPSDVAHQDSVEVPEPPDVAEPDPLAELERIDRQHLLDRALGHLPQSAREALELCYLAQLSQREVAVRLNLSVSALEARLHRARRQLRWVLETELRGEAESLGWFASDVPADEWRESRHWCYFCGKHRMLGNFRPLPNGILELRMRCPACCGPNEAYMNAGDALQMRRAHSFGPAIKRMLHFGHEHFIVPLQGGIPQRCYNCGQLVAIAVQPYAALPYDSPVLREFFGATYTCPSCGILADSGAALALFPHTAVAAFIAQHPRYVIEPQREIAYQGRQAIHFRFADSTRSVRLHIFADRHSLQVLDTVLE